MFNIAEDIDSLSKFKRQTSDFMKRLKKNGNPVVLTVNGKAEIVVQDAESYQKMLDTIEYLSTLEGIKAGLEDLDAGRVEPAKAVHARWRNRK